jgi:hypothetical protein
LNGWFAVFPRTAERHCSRRSNNRAFFAYTWQPKTFAKQFAKKGYYPVPDLLAAGQLEDMLTTAYALPFSGKIPLYRAANVRN